MEELLRRHAGDFDESYHLLHTVDLVKSGVIYRIEIHQKMALGYKKQFLARYFKKSAIRPESGFTARSAADHEHEHHSAHDSMLYWVSLPGVVATADSPRDTLNQALIWLSIHVKREADRSARPGLHHPK